MSGPVPEEDLGGDAPCWAALFAEAEEDGGPVDEPWPGADEEPPTPG